MKTPAFDGARALSVPRTQTISRAIGSGTDSYTGTGSLVNGTWADAPAGEYLIHGTLALSGSVVSAGVYRLLVNNVLISDSGHKADVDGVTRTFTNVHAYTHAGGDLVVSVQHTVSSGTATVANGTCKAIVQRL